MKNARNSIWRWDMRKQIGSYVSGRIYDTYARWCATYSCTNCRKSTFGLVERFAYIRYGIIERENYNKAKSANSKQPGCPEEKIKAIEDAMRYFRMI